MGAITAGGGSAKRVSGDFRTFSMFGEVLTKSQSVPKHGMPASLQPCKSTRSARRTQTNVLQRSARLQQRTSIISELPM